MLQSLQMRCLAAASVVAVDQHGDHADMSFHCPDWTHVEVASHRVAQGWEDWPRRNGFEVRHSHDERVCPVMAAGHK